MEMPSNQSSHTDKISSDTSAIAAKAIDAKNVVASKLGFGEKDDKDENDKTRYEEENRSGEKEKPSNKNSSYTEKISSATSAIADKAVSAKNTVASKLGYGEKGDRDNKTTTHEEKQRRDSGSPAECGKKIAVPLTEKLAPIDGKVAGVGSAVKSKIPGTGTDSGSGIETDGVVKEQDKGVSVNDYLAEKLRPGDEDRARSEVISDALNKNKEEPMVEEGHWEEEDGRSVTKVISDALHDREDEPEREKEHHHRPLGKVTESAEVKRKLGSRNEKTQKVYEESYVNSPGKGLVDKLKDVVGSWFGKAGENQSSQVARGEYVSKNSGTEVRTCKPSCR